MKRWLPFVALIVLLALLSVAVRWWLPPLLAFVGANTDLIQGLEAAVQLLLWLGVGVVALLGYLRRPKEALTLPHVQSGGGAVTTGDVNAGGDFVGRDRIDRQINADHALYVEGNVNLLGAQAAERFLHVLRPRPSGETLREASTTYYQALLDRHRYLNMKGMGVSDRVPLRLPLLDLYVPLKARLELPEGETWRRDLQLAGRQLQGGDDAAAMRLSAPTPVLDLLQKQDGLIVLGDPGAGKTTFLKFLALGLALGRGDALGLGERLPLLVPLSAYANALSLRDALRLDDFIAEYLHESGGDLPFGDMLKAALDAGRALVLLDGLDEVKEPALRHHVAERVADFYSFHRRAGNKFILTSRVVGYREVRPTAEGLAECTLVDFDDDEIAAFVERWTAALERQAQDDTTTAVADAQRASAASCSAPSSATRASAAWRPTRSCSPFLP